MAKRPDIYDPVIPPRIQSLALSATQRQLGESDYLTATFRGRRYTITEEAGVDTQTVAVLEEPTGYWLRADMQFDEHHMPLRIDIALNTPRAIALQSYEREDRTSETGTPPLRRSPAVDTFSANGKIIATYLLYVAERALADAAPARRARASSYDKDETARGRYENKDFNSIAEYPN